MMYPDPEEFRPERFLKDGKFSTEGLLDPYDYTFGFGRRYVIGYNAMKSASLTRV